MEYRVTLKPNQNLFFTSDSHYSHTNICRGVSNWDLTRPGKTRDFKTLEEMNQAIVDGINSVVGKTDYLIHLGDWSFGGIRNLWDFRKQIICENIILVNGNHDHHISRDKILPNCHSEEYGVIKDGDYEHKYGDNRDDMFKASAQELFLETFDILDLRVHQPDGTGKHKKRRYFCSHYPMVSWYDMGDGVPHLHGHVHLPSDKKLNRGKALDVGVDGNNFVPYSWREIDTIMYKQPVATSVIEDDHHV
jgi:calcineurin-like phosphoesterase family protein